jgi:hypothetical protein
MAGKSHNRLEETKKVEMGMGHVQDTKMEW